MIKTLSVVVATIACVLLCGSVANAYPGGVSGRTLKGPNPGCTCHGSQSASFSVVLKAPAAMVVNQAALCTVTVAGTRTGVDIAASSGALTAVSSTLQLMSGELTQRSRTNPGVFIFTFTAPSTTGTQTLYATGTPSYSGVWNHAANAQITITPAVPASPILLAPPNGAANQPLSLTLRWRVSTGATQYRVQLSADSSFASTVLDDSTVVDTTKLVNGLSNAARYFWRVRSRNGAGSSQFSSVWNFTSVLTRVGDEQNVPSEVSLDQNYPNPFNPSTLIRYSIPNRQFVSLRVYDLTGKVIAVLVDGVQEGGQHSVGFNTTELASGLYLYQLAAGDQVIGKKMLLIR